MAWRSSVVIHRSSSIAEPAGTVVRPDATTYRGTIEWIGEAIGHGDHECAARAYPGRPGGVGVRVRAAPFRGRRGTADRRGRRGDHLRRTDLARDVGLRWRRSDADRAVPRVL